MAHTVLNDVRFYVDQYDLSGDSNSHSPTLTQEAVEATPFKTDGPRLSRVYLPGLKTASFSHTLLSGFDTGEAYDVLADNTSAVVSLLPDGGDEGDRALLTSMIRTGFAPFDASIGAVASFTLSGQPTGATTPGYVLHPNTARTSSSQTTGVQAGALLGGTGYANLHVISGTASTLDVKIQSDDNPSFTSATDRITFTQASGATVETGTVTSAGSDDYWRVSYTVGGGSWVFVVTFGIL